MITASGGIVYHARAARGLIKLLNPVCSWNPTRRHVSSWVRQWVESHRFKTLILVGPSAAYLMDDNIWSEIEQLVVIEPDRIAKWVFKRRFPELPRGSNSFVWIPRRDLLPYFSKQSDLFSDFLKNYDPQTTGILFFGCLGQLAFHKNEFSRAEDKSRALLLAATRHFNTASLHDLASVTIPAISAKTASEVSGIQLNLAGPTYNADALGNLIEQVSSCLPRQTTLSWTDHDTYWLGCPKKICTWGLTRKQIHILGFTSQSPH